MQLRVDFDHEQERLQVDRQQVSAFGEELFGSLDGAEFSDTWADYNITNTVMLRPNCMYKSWYTTSTGFYAKLSLSDFTLGTAGNWEERQDQLGSGPWLAVKDTSVSDTAITTGTYAKNRGFIISWYSYGAGENYTALECGWNTQANDSGGSSARITLKFSSNGSCAVYKGGSYVGEGKITGATSSDSQAGQFYQVLLLPFRHRELLVYGLNGDGFSQEFDDIAPDEASPTITPATNFWFKVVEGGGQVQVAPVKFDTSGGYFHSRKLSFADAPLTGTALETWSNNWLSGGPHNYRIYGHPGYGSGTQSASSALYQWDAATAFVANGTRQECRFRVTLSTTNEGYSPFVYGVSMAYVGETANTNATEVHNATNNVTSFTLSVPDDPGGVTVDMSIRDYQGLSADVAAVESQHNRPVKISLYEAVGPTTKVLMDGYGEPDSWDILLNPDAESLGYTVYDQWRVLENYLFRDVMALDGEVFDDAVKKVIECALGYAPTYDFSATTLVIGADPAPRSDDPNILIEAGDSAADWVRRLFDTNAKNWYYGFRPLAGGVTFYALKPADLPSTPILTLYQGVGDAVTAESLTVPEAYAYVTRRVSRAHLPTLATEVRVTGEDRRSGRPIQAFKVDTTLEDVDLAPSLRPVGWLGAKRLYGAYIGELRTQDEVNNSTDILFERLTANQSRIEWVSDLLVFPALDANEGFPLWRGDLITIDGIGDVRITSLSFQGVREVSDGTWRRVTYTGIVE